VGLYENTQDGLKLIAGSTLYADLAVGSIIPFGGSVIPTSFLLCDGSAISRTGYAELFAAIGTAFGTGDGSTTFNLPDLRESVPKGAGETGQTVGAHVKSGGLAVGEFLDDRIQDHTHELSETPNFSYLTGEGNYKVVPVSSGSTPTGTVSNTYRYGATTEVKSVGVNYIIKAKPVAVPADFIDAAEDYIDGKLADKQSTYAADSTKWDAAPTTGSTKPVISDGIKTQFDLVHNELSDVNNILGSKNILPNSATTQVINGITYTVAADGSVNVNGTATADSILHIIPGTIGKLSNIFSKGGNYIISAGTTGTGVDVFFGLEYTGTTWDIGEWLKYTTQLSKEIYIDGTKLNNSSSYIESYIKVNSGTTVSNIKVYPMLRPSSVRDDTYVPYSKTNYELTEENKELSSEISNFAHTVSGNKVDITPYNSSSNAYTAQSDGYLYLNNQNNPNLTILVYINDSAGYSIGGCRHFSGGTTFQITSLYVKKGLKLYRADGSSAGVAWFFPLES